MVFHGKKNIKQVNMKATRMNQSTATDICMFVDLFRFMDFRTGP